VAADPRAHVRADDPLGVDSTLTRSGVGWWAPVPQRQRGPHGGWLLAAVILVAALAGGGWLCADLLIRERLRQRLADRWFELRTCLVGHSKSNLRLGDRLRLLALAAERDRAADAWPARCMAYAEELDALLATPSLRDQVGPAPSLRAVVADGATGEAALGLENFEASLRALDLPSAVDARPVLEPPAPPVPLLAAADLAPLGRVERLAAMQVAMDGFGKGVVRTLIHEGVNGARGVDATAASRATLCRMNDGAHDERWRSAACQLLPIRGLVRARLLDVEPGGAEAVHATREDGGDRAVSGLFDAATGALLWRHSDPRLQALTRADGTSDVLFTARDDNDERELRMARLGPRGAPLVRRVAHGDVAALLLADDLLLWDPESALGRLSRSTLVRARDATTALGSREHLGVVGSGARVVSHCAGRDLSAVLFADAGGEHSVIVRLRRGSMGLHRMARLGDAPQLSCSPTAATVVARRDDAALVTRCALDACDDEILPAVPQGALVMGMGDEVLMAWQAPGEPLRLRIARPDALPRVAERFVVDDSEHGGLDVAELAGVSVDQLALLWLRDGGGRVFALRVEANGTTSGVKVVR
jgi:hypothetical protein